LDDSEAMVTTTLVEKVIQGRIDACAAANCSYDCTTLLEKPPKGVQWKYFTHADANANVVTFDFTHSPPSITSSGVPRRRLEDLYDSNDEEEDEDGEEANDAEVQMRAHGLQRLSVEVGTANTDTIPSRMPRSPTSSRPTPGQRLHAINVQTEAAGLTSRFAVPEGAGTVGDEINEGGAAVGDAAPAAVPEGGGTVGDEMNEGGATVGDEATPAMTEGGGTVGGDEVGAGGATVGDEATPAMPEGGGTVGGDEVAAGGATI